MIRSLYGLPVHLFFLEVHQKVALYQNLVIISFDVGVGMMVCHQKGHPLDDRWGEGKGGAQFSCNRRSFDLLQMALVFCLTYLDAYVMNNCNGFQVFERTESFGITVYFPRWAILLVSGLS